MSNLDVAMRIRLVQDVDKEAKEARDGLQKLKDEADDLGRVRGADKLEKDLKEVSRAADKAERNVGDVADEAKKLGRVKTDRAQREFKQLGQEAKRTERKIRDVNRVAASGKVATLVGPMGKLARSAARLAGGLGLAFGGAEIIGNMDRMKTKADDLAESLTRLMLIEGEVTPERRQQRQERNDRLAVEYALVQDKILEAQAALAQGGLVGHTQDQVLEPILKTSKATGSQPGTIAAAVRALVQNLKVKPTDIPDALDAMLAGGKAGSFEIEDMARSFPELAALYANSGRTGMDAATELIAMAQIVRENVGTSGEAGTALREILSKIYSPEVIKKMGGQGIDVKKVAKEAEKAGEPLISALIAKIEEKGLTDQFGLGELVGDHNARLALQALTAKLEKYKSLLEEVRNGSKGAVDKDLEIVNDLGATKTDRRDAAWEAIWRQLGDEISPKAGGSMDDITRLFNSDFDDYLTRRERPAKIGKMQAEIEKLDQKRQKLEERDRQDANTVSQIRSLTERIDYLKARLNSLVDEEAEWQATKKKKSDDALGKIQLPRSAPHRDGKLKVPDVDAPEAPLRPFNDALDKELEESKAKVSSAVQDMRSMLNFTANPVIKPIIHMPGGNSANSIGGGRSKVSTTNNINGAGNAKTVANRVTRQQNRAIRASQNSALHDVG